MEKEFMDEKLWAEELVAKTWNKTYPVGQAVVVHDSNNQEHYHTHTTSPSSVLGGIAGIRVEGSDKFYSLFDIFPYTEESLKKGEGSLETEQKSKKSSGSMLFDEFLAIPEGSDVRSLKIVAKEMDLLLKSHLRYTRWDLLDLIIKSIHLRRDEMKRLKKRVEKAERESVTQYNLL